VGSTAPLLGYASQTPLHVEGRPESDNIDQPMVGVNSVSPDFFKTLRISLLKGRQFNDADRAGAPRVAIISQSAAERFFPGEEPLGKRIQVSITDDKDPIEIVGLVGNVKYGRLEEVGAPAVYLPYLQPGDSSSVLIVRSNVAPSSLVAAIRREVLALDKNVPLTGVQTMAERSAEVTSRTRFIAALLAVFAGLALLLAGVGIYGVMAYSVSARTRELGIRIALGAQAGDLLRLVLREGARLVVVGLALGLLAAWASLRVLQSQLYDVSATDPLTFGGVALLLAGVALAACYVPARKAMQTDPLAALRYE
jgi:putative ABC transport system permease protein